MFRFTRPDSDSDSVPAPTDDLRWVEDAWSVSGAAVVVLDGGGVVRFASPAAARIMGAPADALRGRPGSEWFPEDPAAGEIGVRSEDGTSRQVRVLVRSLPSDPQGRALVLSAAAATPPDVAARLARLDEGLRALSVISHKINNPLTALLGRAQILSAKAKGDPNLEKAALVIEESASRIADLARELSRTLRDYRQEDVDSILASERAAPAPAGRT